MKSYKFNVGIIGLGNIGGGYNYSKNEFSHGNCFKNSNKFFLKIGVDINILKRKRFEKKFNCLTTSKIDDLKKYDIDTVVIATPTNTHLKLIRKLSKIKSIKILILEKPCGKNFKETNEIINLCEIKNKILFVNYQRIFNPKWKKLRNLLKNQKLFGTFHYSRGFKNNCSHVISFLIYSGYSKLNLIKFGNELILRGKKLNYILLKIIIKIIT